MRGSVSPSRRRREGFALLAVLWAIIGIASLSLLASLAGRQALAASLNRVALERAAWIAEGCAERVRLVIALALSPEAARVPAPARSNGGWGALDEIVAASPLAVVVGCETRLVSTGSTVDLNEAGEEQLRSLFVAMGTSPRAADSLTDALLDWRDPDDLSRPYGAERRWYEARQRPVPRNGAFAAMLELRRVRGFEAAGWADSVLSVDAERTVLARAPLAVIASLPGITAEAVAAVAGSRVRRTPVRDPAVLAAMLSRRGRAALMARFPELSASTAGEPDAWTVTVRARRTAAAPPASVSLRLVRDGSRAAIVRRQRWP